MSLFVGSDKLFPGTHQGRTILRYVLIVMTIIIMKKLEAVRGKHSIGSLQKIATLGTSHIIRKVLQCEA